MSALPNEPPEPRWRCEAPLPHMAFTWSTFAHATQGRRPPPAEPEPADLPRAFTDGVCQRIKQRQRAGCPREVAVPVRELLARLTQDSAPQEPEGTPWECADDHADEILRLRAEGWSYTRIMGATGVMTSSIQRLVERARQRDVLAQAAWDRAACDARQAARDAEVAAAYARVGTVKGTAAALGVGHEAVRNALKRHAEAMAEQQERSAG